VCKSGFAFSLPEALNIVSKGDLKDRTPPDSLPDKDAGKDSNPRIKARLLV